MARIRGAASLLAAAALLLLSVPATARDDDGDFALRLADRGYEALAQKVIDRMIAGSPTPEKRGQAEYARCEMLRRASLIAAGNERSDPAEVRARFGAAGKAFENFLKAHAGHPRAADAEFTQANLMKDFAYYLTKNLEKFPTKDRDGVLKEANKTFDDAIRYLSTIRDREDAKDRSKPIDDERRFFQRNIAWYYLCVAMHDRAMLLPPGDPLRIQQFTRATEETIKFLEETDGQIFGYYASMWLGMQYWHRGQLAQGWSGDDIKQAYEWFSATVDSAEIPDLDNQWPALAKAVHQATFHFGEMCNAVGTVDGTNYQKILVDKVSVLETRLPSTRTERFGLQSVIEKARALSALGRHESAVESLNRVSNWALQADPTGWGRGVDQLAKRALNDVISAIPPDSPIQLAPDTLYKAAEGSLRDGDYGRAVRVYQRVLTVVANEPDPARRKSLHGEFFARCWLKINECYVRMERHLEAFFAADHAVQDYLRSGRKDEDQEYGDLAYYRITALLALSQRAPADRKAAIVAELEEARRFFTEKFPWSDKGVGTTYGVALSKLSEAQGHKGQGNAAKAAEAFKEAIDLFAKIPATESRYRNAQSRIGECLVTSGKPEEGLKHLQEFIRKNLEFWQDPNTPARERLSWGWALFWIANAQDDLKQYAKVVDTLKDFETAFEGAGLDSTFPRVRYLRVSALVKAARGDEAEKEARRLMKENEESGWTVPAVLTSANELQTRAARAAQEGDRKTSVDLRKRCVDLYDFWIRRSSGAGPDDYTFVGQLHETLGNGQRAAELWTKAREMYLSRGDAEKAELLTVYLSGLLVGEGRFAEALPQFESLFIRTPDDVSTLREVFDRLKSKPSAVELSVHQDRVKKVLGKIVEAVAKDPAGAALASEARRFAGGGDTEALLRLFADTPDQRRALAAATAFTLLGEDPNMPAELKIAVFGLVKRSPDLMANLARCYDELWLSDVAYSIRALNLYSTLVDSAPAADAGRDDASARYGEKWFDWKFRLTRLYLNIGLKYQNETALKTVCGILRAMETVNEIPRANKAREDLGKEFLALRDQADQGLRKMGKEGCK